ncbi:uncharacterized protein Z519_08620 [Cladophialophora bantiana CBS 173.52]|uniref:EthD domain-containing protein n=1 Tax=Cladophialophora bantiana (strain ATCC 10958 / CBS 173.52 / CDC B-1940 / NIH 8579) TaxID=1442370 RepID=A0A0D2FWD0_CLAB1|nr:uncharacterized protein Z519_08620 [Cladophialophora bantiana CBS 173.52]KIW90837.1 hypothetical protein Z519_08620 [Cladophialophora bantiana CBS 173.52]
MDEFQDHYENQHVPLVLRSTPSISRYVRNYVRADSTFSNLDSLTTPLCDVVTEAWFDSEADFAKFQLDASRPEVRKLISEDELSFLDRSAIRMFLVRECISTIS